MELLIKRKAELKDLRHFQLIVTENHERAYVEENTKDKANKTQNS